MTKMTSYERIKNRKRVRDSIGLLKKVIMASDIGEAVRQQTIAELQLLDKLLQPPC